MRNEERIWTGAALAASAAAAILVRWSLKESWRRVKNSEPPLNPASSSVPWRDALTWAVVTGAAAGLARVLARRGVASAWTRLMGNQPAGVD